MIREKLIFKVEQTIPPSWSEILGANYYAHFDFSNSSRVVEVAGLVQQIATNTNTTGFGTVPPFTQATGTKRPSLVTDATLNRSVAEFDGVDDWMSIASSTGLFNFLHNSNGGAVIVVFKPDTTPPAQLQRILANQNSIGTDIGISLMYRDGYSTFVENVVNYCANGTGVVYANNSGNNATTNNKWSYQINNLDPSNGTAADRITITIDGTDYNNNIQTNAPSASNAANDLYMGNLPSGLVGYAGKISEIIFADAQLTSLQVARIKSRLAYDYGTFPV